MSQSLCFNEFTFSPVIRDNQPWFRSSEIATVLGYAREDTLSRLYDRNADEFSSDMTQVVEISVDRRFGAEGRARIFSLRGCHLLAMFARTPVAKAFRRWVLDVIEQYGNRVPVVDPVTLNDTSRPSRRTDPERKALTAIINTWVGMAPIHYASARAQVNAHFGVASVDALTVAQVKEAIQWVQAKIDALPAVPAPARTPALPAFNVYRDRVKELDRLEEEWIEFAGETRSRLHQFVNELLRVKGSTYPELLNRVCSRQNISKDPLLGILQSNSYNAQTWIDAGISEMRTAIRAAKTANRLMLG